MDVLVLHLDLCASLKAVDVWERQSTDAVLPGLQLVGSCVIVVSEGHSVLVQTGQAVPVNLQVWPRIVRKNHGEKGLRVADKLVHVPLTSHLRTDKSLINYDLID